MTPPNRLDLGASPTLDLPLRFLLLAPVFGIAAGLLMAWRPEQLFAHRLTGTALAFNHLLTLGFIGLAQIGALTQLLPVLAGASLTARRLVGSVAFPLWSLGALILATGFAFGYGIALAIAGVCLLAASLTLLIPLGIALVQATSSGPSVPALRIAVVALIVTLALGLYLLSQRLGLMSGQAGLDARLSHPVVGLLGWTLIPVAGIAYQVVPMFQITPAYPRWFSRFWAPVMGGLLLLFIALGPGDDGLWAWLSGMGLLAGAALFALMTLDRQGRRKRKRTDVTLLYWRLAMISLLGATLAWATHDQLPSGQGELLAGALFLMGFAVPVINGMIMKIVPFLVWLHLKNQQVALGPRRGHRIPLMDEVIPARHQRLQWWLHVATLVSLGLCAFHPKGFGTVAGITMAAGMTVLAGLIARAWHLYRRELERMAASVG